ncbi:2-phospho-L-lactate guanylyltransferase [Halarchaeum rubridurum]|uniref:2-phospho-L-lactate guanylyltransferase n=1 Tax=Halarchaeum rubridurum TaxID=489911 RepID=A0A830FJH6_9EURY|nr:2-phospho-L-lactate guanylyltransferase [Halarchaeum rubridurum]MBP1954025.1 2-phospho-L-lactate guanylyltransferase [Halarchaeum rubridurum]GGM56758.1 2-phospho-L-lactate guanylyltransferase [Halarchaeum rubridurum]
MRTLVPFDATDPKTRLEGLFSPAERRDLAAVMLADVIEAVRAAGGDPLVVATADVACDAPVQVDERALSDAVNARLEPGTAVVMADLALATPRVLRSFFAATGDVVLAPGLGGGTNALVVRDDGFAVDYHGASYRDHLRSAAAAGCSVREFDATRLALDVDERADLADALVRGEGRTPGWLRDAGVALADGSGRANVARRRDEKR